MGGELGASRAARLIAGLALVAALVTALLLLGPASPARSDDDDGDDPGPHKVECHVLAKNYAGDSLTRVGMDKGDSDDWLERPPGGIPSAARWSSYDSGNHGCKAEASYEVLAFNCSNNPRCRWNIKVALRKVGDGKFDADVDCSTSLARISCHKLDQNRHDDELRVVYSMCQDYGRLGCERRG